MKITLPGRIPSKKNSKQLIYRNKRAYFIPSENYTLWQQEQSYRIKKIRIPIANATIKITIFAPDKRTADLSNKAESVMDLLVDNGILKDDSWFVVNKLLLVFGGVDKENPRAEVEINLIDPKWTNPDLSNQ